MKKKNKVIRIRLVPMLLVFALIILMPSKLSNKVEINEIAGKEIHYATNYMGTDEWYKDYTYTLDDNALTITLTSYNGEATEVVVPGTTTIDGKKYTTVIQGGVYKDNENITKVKFENEVSAGTSTRNLFNNCKSLKEIDLGSINTANVTNMERMFYGCEQLTSIDVSTLDTKNVTEFYCMFAMCENLTTLDLSNFDTSKATSMGSMFSNCYSLTELDISKFNTENVEYMSGMFSNCDGITKLDLSNFNTNNVKNMSHMFSYCEKLSELNLNSFNTTRVDSMSDMFYGSYRINKVTLGKQWVFKNESAYFNGVWKKENDNSILYSATGLTQLYDGSTMSGVYIKAQPSTGENGLTVNPNGGSWNGFWIESKLTFEKRNCIRIR